MYKAIIITAPSGAGKSTIAAHLLSRIADLEYSVSATTRPPRKSEVEGVDYYFISNEQFKEKIENDEFVEWEEVYNGVFYGTLKSEIERLWDLGKAVLYVVDVVGARDLKVFFGDQALSIFIEPPSLDELKERLTQRGTETRENLERRLERAMREMSAREAFDLVILNDDLDMAKANAEAEVRRFLSRPNS